MLICFVFCGVVMFIYKIKLFSFVEWKKQSKSPKHLYVTIASKKELRFTATKKLAEKKLISNVLQTINGFLTGVITRHFVLSKEWDHAS